MNKRLYLKQRLPMVLLQAVCMAALSFFLYLNGNSTDSILLILLAWVLVLGIFLGTTYLARKKRMEKLLALTEQLEERYLISEVMEEPRQAEDLVWYRILKMADKSMLEKIGEVERERSEYKEYIEQWIHEIKTPIAAMKLICENRRLEDAGQQNVEKRRLEDAGRQNCENRHSEVTRQMLVELEKTSHYTEQALYYARSEHTEKDYSVREISLFPVVHRAIAENKYLLLKQGVRLMVEEEEVSVFSDEKWLCFILNQLIVNAVKYGGKEPAIRFYARREENRRILCIEDNGIGIPEEDLPRIFEKGFTGKNGRTAENNATGIGLYLCKRLCEKLDIGIHAESSEKGTVISLSFRINEWIYQVQGD